MVATVITADDVRALLSSDAAEPVLVMTQGSFAVIASSELENGAYEGAVLVADRGQLLREVPELSRKPDQFALEELASRLTVQITELGG
jgi:hypothetical protein